MYVYTRIHTYIYIYIYIYSRQLRQYLCVCTSKASKLERHAERGLPQAAVLVQRLCGQFVTRSHARVSVLLYQESKKPRGVPLRPVRYARPRARSSVPRELPAASPAGLGHLHQYLYRCTSKASKLGCHATCESRWTSALLRPYLYFCTSRASRLECSTCTSARPTWMEARPLPPPSPHLRQYLYFRTV
jgi:hypothetical protein